MNMKTPVSVKRESVPASDLSGFHFRAKAFAGILTLLTAAGVGSKKINAQYKPDVQPDTPTTLPIARRAIATVDFPIGNGLVRKIEIVPALSVFGEQTSDRLHHLPLYAQIGDVRHERRQGVTQTWNVVTMRFEVSNDQFRKLASLKASVVSGRNPQVVKSVQLSDVIIALDIPDLAFDNRLIAGRVGSLENLGDTLQVSFQMDDRRYEIFQKFWERGEVVIRPYSQYFKNRVSPVIIKEIISAESIAEIEQKLSAAQRNGRAPILRSTIGGISKNLKINMKRQVVVFNQEDKSLVTGGNALTGALVTQMMRGVSLSGERLRNSLDRPEFARALADAIRPIIRTTSRNASVSVIRTQSELEEHLRRVGGKAGFGVKLPLIGISFGGSGGAHFGKRKLQEISEQTGIQLEEGFTETVFELKKVNCYFYEAGRGAGSYSRQEVILVGSGYDRSYRLESDIPLKGFLKRDVDNAIEQKLRKTKSAYKNSQLRSWIREVDQKLDDEYQSYESADESRVENYNRKEKEQAKLEALRNQAGELERYINFLRSDLSSKENIAHQLWSIANDWFYNCWYHKADEITGTHRGRFHGGNPGGGAHPSSVTIVHSTMPYNPVSGLLVADASTISRDYKLRSTSVSNDQKRRLTEDEITRMDQGDFDRSNEELKELKENLEREYREIQEAREEAVSKARRYRRAYLSAIQDRNQQQERNDRSMKSIRSLVKKIKKAEKEVKRWAGAAQYWYDLAGYHKSTERGRSSVYPGSPKSNWWPDRR